MALAAEGGYDAVVMRDLAEQANVAVGTIYNYFTSKDHLLGAAFVEWMAELEQRITSRPVQGDTPAERVMDILTRLCRGLARQPKLVSAIFSAVNTGREIAEYEGQVGVVMADLLGRALDLGDPDLEWKITRTLEHVLHSALMAWIHGRMDVEDVLASLGTAAHLLLDRPGPGPTS